MGLATGCRPVRRLEPQGDSCDLLPDKRYRIMERQA